LLVFLQENVRRGGRPGDAGDRKEIADLMRRDPEGAEQLATAVGLPVQVVRALQAGHWERRSLMTFELRAVSRLLSDPRELRRCVALDYRRFRRCSLIDALRHGRRVSGNRADWLQEVRRTHTVYEG
jgi:hypothetical protein